MNLLNAVGLHLINKRIYTRGRLRREGEETFKEFATDAGRAVMAMQTPVMQARIRTNWMVFTEAAYWLGLPGAATPLRILDIGSFNGMWPHACRRYGHDALATDLPATFEKPEVKAVLDLLGVNHRPLRVEPLLPLPDLGFRPDLLTGFRTRFHYTKPNETGLSHETHWGVEEWDFFLKDAAGRLSERGRMFFLLNRLQEKSHGTWFPDDIMALFADRGGLMAGPWLRFNDLSRLR